MYQDLERTQLLCFKLANDLEHARKDLSFDAKKSTTHMNTTFTVTTSTSYTLSDGMKRPQGSFSPQDSRVLHNALHFQKFLLNAPSSMALAYQIALEKAVQDICHVSQRRYQLTVMASQLEHDHDAINNMLSKMRERGVFYDRYKISEGGEVFKELSNLKFDNDPVTIKLIEKEKVLAVAQRYANVIAEQLKLAKPSLLDQPLFKPKF